MFTVLRGSYEETGLHSAWLAYLLNPNAEHDCGGLFLKLFIEILQLGVRRHSDESETDKLEILRI